MSNSTSWDDLAADFLLPQDVIYLNHGSFGPSPRQVLAERNRWLERVESQPCDFFIRELGGALASARQRVASFVGATEDDLVFVENATTAMNIVAASVQLRPGDEVLLTDHEYGAVHRIWEMACQRAGARLVECRVALPLPGDDELIDTVFASVTNATRLLVFSHVTSATAAIFPAKQLCARARQRGLAVCIDGPHAIAMLDLEIGQLECDYYTASCHKWLSAPFGAGFLYVHPRAQDSVTPIVRSWGRIPAHAHNPKASWQDEFDWSGTRDVTAYLSIPAAIDYLSAIPLAAFRQRTHELAKYAADVLGALDGMTPVMDYDSSGFGSMVAIGLPPCDAARLQQALRADGIEVPVMEWQARQLIRVSCHVYTRASQIDRLAVSLTRALGAR